MPEAYQLTTGGVIRTADGAFIPDDTSNADWQTYLDWDATGTADSASVLALVDKQAEAKALVDSDAANELNAHVPVLNAALFFAYSMKVQEAIDIEGAGSPASSRYPMLQAMVDSGAESSLANAGTTIRAEWAAIRDSVGDIEEVRRKAFADIDAAASNAAVDTVLAGIAWPS